MDANRMAAILAEEMVADLKAWVDMAERWGQRYEQYGKQFGELVPPEIRESIEADMKAQLARLGKARLGQARLGLGRRRTGSTMREQRDG